MEKSTISALLIAGGTVAAGIFQAWALRAAKRKREQEQAEKEKSTDQSASASKQGGSEANR